MTVYRFMDGSFIVPVCLHDGPADIAFLAVISAETNPENSLAIPRAAMLPR